MRTGEHSVDHRVDARVGTVNIEGIYWRRCGTWMTLRRAGILPRGICLISFRLVKSRMDLVVAGLRRGGCLDRCRTAGNEWHPTE